MSEKGRVTRVYWFLRRKCCGVSNAPAWFGSLDTSVNKTLEGSLSQSALYKEKKTSLALSDSLAHDSVQKRFQRLTNTVKSTLLLCSVFKQKISFYLGA